MASPVAGPRTSAAPHPTPPTSGDTGAASGLRRRTFVGFFFLVFLGWSLEALVQPLIPLVVLDRGGSAALVGLVAAAYSLPSVVVRSLIGRAIDHRGHDAIQRRGALILGASAAFLAAPPLAVTVLARLAQGFGWAMYSTANNFLLARLAPRERRGELSGYYNTMRALGLLAGPPVGLWLYVTFGAVAFLVAGALGAIAFVAASQLGVPDQVSHGAQEPPPADRRVARRWIAGLFEPSAIPAMLMIATFMSSQTIFLVFAPVYALAIGAPVTVLALFYPAFGGTLAIAPLLGGRVSDRLGRRRTVWVGCVVAIAGLLTAALPGGMVPFTAGSVLVAVAIAIVTPAIAAATMDLAPPGRLGSATATYAVGYQLAAGLGGAVWGLIIATWGFPWPFIVAAVLQSGTMVLAWKGLPSVRASLPPGPRPTRAA